MKYAKERRATTCLLTSISIVVMLSSCGSDGAKTTDQTEKFVLSDSLYRTLQIDTVKESQIHNSVTINGKIIADQNKVVQMYPLVSGQVTGVKVMLGDQVQKGEILAVIRSSEMAGLSSDLVAAQGSAEVSQRDLQVTADMYKSGLSSEKDYMASQANHQQAIAELKKIRETIQINGGGTGGNYIMKAPISGFIVDKNATDGMDIRSDNNTNMFTISDLKNVWVVADVYESDIASVHLGDSVAITTLSYPDTIFYGKINKILSTLDPVNKAMKVLIVLPNPGYLLKPEMFASVTIDHPEHREMPCIPSNALIFDDNQNYVLVIRDRENIDIRPVTVAQVSDRMAFISSGLQNGEHVIASNELLLYQALKH